MHVDLQVWLDHFEYHATHRAELPGSLPQDLTPYEQRLVSESLAAMQLRERSAGRALLRTARAYEPPLARIIALLVTEERYHARLLATFMAEHGMPRRQRRGVHRWLHAMRQFAGFELQISALVTADLIRKVCYRALERATGSQQLKRLCDALVADELAHVGFESDVLHAIHASKSPLGRTSALLAHRAYFAGSAVAAWFTHRKMLKAAGYRCDTFLQECSVQYTFYLESGSVRVAAMTPSES